MEKNPYMMAKLGLTAKEELPASRGCGFYAKYFFLFLSLIQFLIILGLVLFMVYGNPHGATEKHVQGLNQLLQNCTGHVKAQEAATAGLKRQLNASQAETRLVRGQAGLLNATLRACLSEKNKMYELQKENLLIRHIAQDCTFNLHLLNLSCPVQVAALQEQLKALQVRIKLDQDDFEQKTKAFQEKTKLAEEEERKCRLEKLQLQTHSEKHRELQSKVMATLDPVYQQVVSTVDQAQLSRCYSSDNIPLQDRCLDLARRLRSQLDNLAWQVNQKVEEEAQRSGALASQKEACAQNLQERDRQLSTQQDRAEREKLQLREAHEAEVKKMSDEQQKLAREKEDLKLQLEQSKQACLRMKVNTAPPANPSLRLPGSAANPAGHFPTFLGNIGGTGLSPNLFSQQGSWRLGQPSVGAQGSPSILTDRTRFHEPKKDTPQSAKLPIQPPLSPGGPPSG
uniref:Plasmalemma vesicle-associated protein n=1 Tax=Pogona vitticeps TaxID=103695 RepID=A0ABM5ELA4_9SAUR